MVMVLVVDDERPIVQMLRDVLEEDGYTVAEAYDGNDALQAARDLQPDIVVTDVMMPSMSGTELARRLLTEPPVPHLQVIVMSAVTPPDLAEAPVAAFLRKPFSIASVSEVIAHTLATR